MKLAVSFGLFESQRPSWAGHTSQLGNSAQLLLLFLLVQCLLFLFDILLEPLSILLYLIWPRQFYFILIHNICTSSLIFLTRHIRDRWFLLHDNVTAGPHRSSLVLHGALRMNTCHSPPPLHEISELLRLEHLHKVLIPKMLVLLVLNSIIIAVLFFFVGSKQMLRIENDFRSISSHLLNTVDCFFNLALNVNGFSQ